MKESGKFIKSSIKGYDDKEKQYDLDNVKSRLEEKGVIFEEGFPKKINKKAD